MEWIKYFSAFGGATFCSLLVSAIFNRIVNGTKKRRIERELLEEEKRQNELNKMIDTIIENIDGKLKVITIDSEKTKLGLQALLRSELLMIWNKWSELGYAPIYARENFENCYKRYHELGANGVMDDIRIKFLDLPLSK